MAVLLFALILLLKTSQPGECLNTRQTLFHKIKQNYLLNHVIATKQADNEFECVMHCVDEFSCASVNFKISGVGKGLCELNNLTLPTTKDESILNPEFDHLHIARTEESNLVQSGVEPNTTQKSGDFDLVLKNVQNFTLHVEDVPELSNITLMFWINILSSEADSMTILSYDLDKKTQGFWLNIWEARVILKFPSSKKVLHVPPINDGYWHHVGVSWSLGKYAIFLDGTLVYSGNDLGSSSPLKAGGVFILGPKLKSTNGTPEHSFSGKLSQLNVWSEFLSTTDDVEKKFISQSCLNIEFGDVINWSSLKNSYCDGMVVQEQPSSCKPLRKSPKYDIVITQSKDVHTLKWEETQPLDAFTIATWMKYEKTQMDLDIEPLYHRYVDYTNASGTSLLLFYLTADNLTLEINGVHKREARIPIFWNEDPAYWHHIATTWLSSKGHWKIYLDGSLVSIMHDVASNIIIPTGGQLSLQFSGYMQNISQSRLNIWNYEIDGHALSLMANKGPLFENGNIFAWYGIKSKVKEDVYFKETPDDLYNSRAESVYQMNFTEASVKNYVKIENVVNYNLTKVSSCFWAKFLKTKCAIFAYSSLKNYVEFQAFFHNSTKLDLQVKNDFWRDKGPKISAYDSWHFYCLQWRSFDGLMEVYQDGKKIGTRYRAKNHTILPNGVIVLGQELDSYGGGFDKNQAFKGSLAGLNLWSQFLTTNVIQGMASGILNVNGNLLQWRDFRDHVFGDITIRDESIAEIPEYRVQNLRDEWCKRHISKAFAYARFIRGRETDGYRWRCVQAAAMLDENMCYDITKNSSLYHTKDTKKELLGIN